MAAKLNQIIALTNGIKGRTTKVMTEVYKKFQKEALFKGISRTYRPATEDGEMQPPEHAAPKYTVTDGLSQAITALTALFDAVATQEYANCSARADIVVGDTVILSGVPVGTLLFLEKQVTDLATLVGHIPTLDDADTWETDDNTGAFVTPVTVTTRTKKVPRNHVKYEATKEHPAQVDVFTEDVIVGHWDTKKFSTAIREADKRCFLENVYQLSDAVKNAREAANMVEVANQKIGKEIFDFVFLSK